MTSKMWGGRFSAGPSAVMAEINISLPFDKRMAAQDVRGSIAHAEMLVARGIISSADGKSILEGLGKVAAELASGQFPFKTALEDIHMNVEDRLKELVGPAAGCLHTARSRNDQVATDFRLWTRDQIDNLDASLKTMQSVLIDKAEKHSATIMPGFTHLQVGQPVTFGHHLLAYVEMLGRDRGRLADARKRLNESPLGAGALGGTSFPIDRAMTAKSLALIAPWVIPWMPWLTATSR